MGPSLTAPRLRVTAKRTAQGLRWPGAGRFRVMPASSRRVNSLNGTPSARQNSRSSTTSIRRSPRSHLLTNDCVSSSRFASSAWVTPALFRVARNCRRKREYPSECSDFSMRALQLHEALGYSQYWNSPTSTIAILTAEVFPVSEPNCFRPFDDLPPDHENCLTSAFLSLLRACPVAHLTFLDMIRDIQLRKPCLSSSIMNPTALLSQIADIRTQEGRIELEEGDLLSVALTSKPWQTEELVTLSSRIPVYDGILYYGDNWVIILENKPQPEPSVEELLREMKPNLPEGSPIHINPYVVNIVWRDVLLRLHDLLRAGILHGPEAVLLKDFRKYVHRHFPHLNPYATIAACDGSPEAILERCGAVLESIAPDQVGQEGIREYYIRLDLGLVGRVYLRPDPTSSRDAGEGAERVCLEMYPALSVPQAQRFYRDVNPESFCGLELRSWTVKPHLALRFQGTVKCQPEVLVSGEKWFSFWQSHPDMIRGNIDRNLVATGWWDVLASAGMVRPDDRDLIFKGFSARQNVNTCPGWMIQYSWSVAEAERLDSQKGMPQDTAFVGTVRENLQQAFQAMGQDFESLLSQDGVAATPEEEQRPLGGFHT